MAKGHQPGRQIPELAWEILVNQQKMHKANAEGGWRIERWSLRLLDPVRTTMGLLRRLFGKSEVPKSALNSPDLTEVGQLMDQRTVFAMAETVSVDVVPWSSGRLGSIFAEVNRNPAGASLMEARRARQCLSKFWLHAPVDQLESLYRSVIGQTYRTLVGGRLAEMTLVMDEQQWRDAISQKLRQAAGRPEAANLLLAVMPYYARGSMRVSDPLRTVPQWLMHDYAALYEPDLLQRIQQPATLIAPNHASLMGPPTTPISPPQNALPPSALVSPAQPKPQLAPKPPVLSNLRGNDAYNQLQEEDFSSRMNGLINLYTIDPTDDDVNRELGKLRRLLGQIALDLDASQLEPVYRGAYGELHRQLMRCGFTSSPITQQDANDRAELAAIVANVNQPGGINALLAALLFYPAGKIQFSASEQAIPRWLLNEMGSAGASNQTAGVY